MRTEDVSELLAQSGFDLAHQMIHAAMEEAENGEQIGNQIFVLRHLAVSILAHEAFNLETQHGVPFEKYFTEVLQSVALFKEQIREGYLKESGTH